MLLILKKVIVAIANSMIIINAIYFSIKLRFPQLKIKNMIFFLKKSKNQKINSTSSLMMSLSSKIGVGSLAGTALAIIYGGVGSIFWMWVFSFILVINSYVEVILAIKFREKMYGFDTGGPAYYMKNGLKNQNLARIFAIVFIFTYTFGFLAIQNNTVVILTNNLFNFNKITISVIISLIALFFFFKNLNKLSKYILKIFPIMCLMFISLSAFVIIKNYNIIPKILFFIIKEAFNLHAIKGGIIWALIIGLQRLIFATESGLGTSAIASSTTTNSNYYKQAYMEIIGVYFISLVIITLTAIIILSSNYSLILYNNISGIELVLYAFSFHFGKLGNLFLLILVFLFAFSTIIAGYYYGESNLKILTKNKKILLLFKFLVFFFIFIGGLYSSNNLWQIIDICVSFLAIINIYSMFKLRDFL